jgi:hypothetical protein
MSDKFVTAFSEAHEWQDTLYHLKWPAMVTIYGTPKSGKTYLLLHLLENVKSKFDEIVCYLGAKDATKTFLDLAGEKNTKPVVKILYTFNEADLRKYYQKLEDTQIALIKAKKKPKNVLIVADDILSMAGMMKTNRQTPGILEEVASSYRHVNLSMIITSQKYMQVIPSLRSLNFKYMFVTSLGKSDLEKIADEHENMFFDKKHISELFFDIRKNGLGHVLLIDNDSFDKDRFKYVHPDNSITKITSKREK